jgi:hypothetical protein
MAISSSIFSNSALRSGGGKKACMDDCVREVPDRDEKLDLSRLLLSSLHQSGLSATCNDIIAVIKDLRLRRRDFTHSLFFHVRNLNFSMHATG